MEEMTGTKVYLPQSLKRRAFAAFALAGTNFSRWSREHLARWLREVGEEHTRTEQDQAKNSESGSK
jgi:cytochrome b subunit of formate dehydrogenase